jgi:hypothetical protein
VYEHLGLAIVSRYDNRLRNEQGRTPVKNRRFQQQGRIVDIEHDTGRHARSKLLPDPCGDVQFRRRAQPLLRKRSPHHAQGNGVRLGNSEC